MQIWVFDEHTVDLLQMPRFRAKIISHAVWPCCRFNKSFGEVEEFFLERGIDVSYETIRRWVGKFWLWRAVDQNGVVLDEILQSRRNTKAAKRLLARLMKRHCCTPKRFITDKLRSYISNQGTPSWAAIGSDSRRTRRSLGACYGRIAGWQMG